MADRSLVEADHVDLWRETIEHGEVAFPLEGLFAEAERAERWESRRVEYRINGSVGLYSP